MAREGKKIEEFKMYLNSYSYPAVLRMSEQHNFILEVHQLRFEGSTPKDLIRQAQMRLENEHGLEWFPLILVDPDLEDGRLNFRRVFHTTSRDGKEVFRAWCFDGSDEKGTCTWYRGSEIKTLSLLEGGVPGDRVDSPKLSQQMMPYTSARWSALVKLDQMLAEAQKAVAEKLSQIIQGGDLDDFLSRATSSGTPRLIWDEAMKGTGK